MVGGVFDKKFSVRYTPEIVKNWQNLEFDYVIDTSNHVITSGTKFSEKF